jgi:hypothetical protein
MADCMERAKTALDLRAWEEGIGGVIDVDGVIKGDWEAIAPLVLMTIAIVTIVELVRAAGSRAAFCRAVQAVHASLSTAL